MSTQEIEYIGMLEIDGAVVYIEKHNFPNKSSLVAGTACNSGMIPYKSIPYDDYFSLDENLQAFVEVLESE